MKILRQIWNAVLSTDSAEWHHESRRTRTRPGAKRTTTSVCLLFHRPITWRWREAPCVLRIRICNKLGEGASFRCSGCESWGIGLARSYFLSPPPTRIFFVDAPSGLILTLLGPHWLPTSIIDIKHIGTWCCGVCPVAGGVSLSEWEKSMALWERLTKSLLWGTGGASKASLVLLAIAEYSLILDLLNLWLKNLLCTYRRFPSFGHILPVLRMVNLTRGLFSLQYKSDPKDDIATRNGASVSKR